MIYAFPHNTVVVDKEGGIIEHHKGMELRDYFVAQHVEKLKGFGQDTVSSLAIYIREMKK